MKNLSMSCECPNSSALVSFYLFVIRDCQVVTRQSERQAGRKSHNISTTDLLLNVKTAEHVYIESDA